MKIKRKFKRKEILRVLMALKGLNPTSRQLDILDITLDYKWAKPPTSGQIALKLDISPSTVRVHRKALREAGILDKDNIMDKDFYNLQDQGLKNITIEWTRH